MTMKSGNSSLLWTQPDWLSRAQAWIKTELSDLGLRQTGPTDQFHVRPWSTVMRVPTDDGDIYFKAGVDALRYEAAVTKRLASLRPESMPRVLSSEDVQGWLLLSDGGARLRTVLSGEEDIIHWEAILPQYAKFQMESAGHTAVLLRHGAPDRRLAVLPAKYGALLAKTDFMCLGRPDGLTEREFALLERKTGQVEELCTQLASFSVPHTIEHGDLHDGNIFIKDGRYFFFDWGDSSVSHPFFSMRTTFVSIENRFGYEEKDSRFDSLADRYLEPWAKVETPARLRQAFGLSQRLAPIVAALRWARAIEILDDVSKSDYAVAIPSLLQEFLSLNE